MPWLAAPPRRIKLPAVVAIAAKATARPASSLLEPFRGR
jgi:hypothetical protein